MSMRKKNIYKISVFFEEFVGDSFKTLYGITESIPIEVDDECKNLKKKWKKIRNVIQKILDESDKE